MPYAQLNHKFANDPDHWRLRAEEARTVAESFINPAARAQMMQIAECYDRLVELAGKGPIVPQAQKH